MCMVINFFDTGCYGCSFIGTFAQVTESLRNNKIKHGRKRVLWHFVSFDDSSKTRL